MFHTSQWADLPPGNCAKGAPGELDDIMFEDRSPIPGTNNKIAALEAQQNYRAAKNMCVGCPIKPQCLEQGMREENLRNGVWGGLTAGERVLLANPLSESELARWGRFILALEGGKMRAHSAPREFCGKGHRMTEDNVYRRSNGRRQCRACQLDADRRRRERLQQAAAVAKADRCKNGHLYAEHGKVYKDGGAPFVRCTECRRQSERRRAAERKQRAA